MRFCTLQLGYDSITVWKLQTVSLDGPFVRAFIPGLGIGYVKRCYLLGLDPH